MKTKRVEAEQFDLFAASTDRVSDACICTICKVEFRNSQKLREHYEDKHQKKTK